MKQYNLTHLNWSVNDKVEGASILRPGASSTGNWSPSDLTASGTFVRELIQDYNAGNDDDSDGDSGGGDSGGVSAAAQCQFLISNEWGDGLVGEVRITNTSTQVISQAWAVQLDFSDGSTINNSWNTSQSTSNPYTLSPLAWNAVIEPGLSVSFGIQLNKGSPGVAAQTPEVTGEICN